MPIQAIPTWYKNIFFRSRLEARWAVFFDALALVWAYEPPPPQSGMRIYYRPDFWLPELACWLEIKSHTDAVTPTALGKLVDLVRGTNYLAYLFVGDFYGGTLPEATAFAPAISRGWAWGECSGCSAAIIYHPTRRQYHQAGACPANPTGFHYEPNALADSPRLTAAFEAARGYAFPAPHTISVYTSANLNAKG